MKIDMSRFRATFFTEAVEHLEVMENSLLQLEDNPHDSELLSAIFRAAHSIKGASSTFGIERVGKFTHVLESLLDRLREGTIQVESSLVEVLLRSVDTLRGLLAAEKDNSECPADWEDLLKELMTIENAPDQSEATIAREAARSASRPSQRYSIEFQPGRNLFRTGQDPILLLRELSSLGSLENVRLLTDQLPPFNQLDPEACYLGWKLDLVTSRGESEIHDVFMFLDESTKLVVTPESEKVGPQQHDSEGREEAAGARVSDVAHDSPPLTNEGGIQESSARNNQAEQTERRQGTDRRSNVPATTSRDNETVRVDRDRLDKLINQIGELVIGASMVEMEWSGLHPTLESSSLTQLGKIVRDLQEMSLSLRMVPIAATFQKMARVVRDLSKKLGKQIRFETEGEETELDKTVVDQIGDPILHMIRNAADHGIEMPDDRIAQGKPAEGRIHLRAYHQGGNIVIEISDDGKGLNRQAILRKAIERGMVSADAALSDSEILDLIFQPGFSTAAAVTDVSGRGVGMDVVRKNVESLQGAVSVQSETGRGATVSIRLPLTLAILDGLLVRLGEQIYIVPLLSVIESMRPAAKDIQRVAGRGEVISLRGEVIPVMRLYELFQVPADVTSPSDGLVVIVEDHDRKFALLVDELLGQQQVVIKNLETNVGKVPGVAGATILGDGRVALILDVFGLYTLQGLRPRSKETLATPIIPAAFGLASLDVYPMAEPVTV